MFLRCHIIILLDIELKLKLFMYLMITKHMMYATCKNVVLNRLIIGKNRQNYSNLTHSRHYISGHYGLISKYLITKLNMGTIEIIPHVLTPYLPYSDKN